VSGRKLSEKLKLFRIDRPSEWMMDEFARDAESLEAENAELREAAQKLLDESDYDGPLLFLLMASQILFLLMAML